MNEAVNEEGLEQRSVSIASQRFSRLSRISKMGGSLLSGIGSSNRSSGLNLSSTTSLRNLKSIQNPQNKQNILENLDDKTDTLTDEQILEEIKRMTEIREAKRLEKFRKMSISSTNRPVLAPDSVPGEIIGSINIASNALKKKMGKVGSNESLYTLRNKNSNNGGSGRPSIESVCKMYTLSSMNLHAGSREGSSLDNQVNSRNNSSFENGDLEAIIGLFLGRFLDIR